MKTNDLILFYHSNIKPPSIVGVAKVIKEGYPDDTALNPKDKHYDPNSTKEKPIWYRVDIGFVKKLESPVSLETVKKVPSLKNMLFLKRSRLSVQPVNQKKFEIILKYS